ncbi:MAG: hypothetical protein JNK52_10080 [Zoogloeaceae bacterium]|nr:hypothetical protein [Zoogloeaceae bacterium]
MRRGLSSQRLIAVFMTSAMLFNYPIISLFDGSEPVFGMPPIFLYLFAIWAVLIGLVALIVERTPK